MSKSFSREFFTALSKNNVKYEKPTTRAFCVLNENGVLSGTVLDGYRKNNVVFAIENNSKTLALYAWQKSDDIVKMLNDNNINFASGVITAASILTNKTLKQFYQLASQALTPSVVKKIKAIEFSSENVEKSENFFSIKIEK